MARPTVARQAEVAARRAEAIRLNIAGHTWADIAGRLGYRSAANACEDVRRALRAAKADMELAADELRTLELARLDEAHRIAWKAMHARHLAHGNGRVVTLPDPASGEPVPLTDWGPNLAAIDRVVKVSESRRRLLGSDAPARVSVEAEALGAEIGDLIAALGGGGDGADD